MAFKLDAIHIREPHVRRIGRLFLVGLLAITGLSAITGPTVFTGPPAAGCLADPAGKPRAQENGQAAGEPYLVRLLSQSPVSPGGEIRALWVVRDALTSRERIDRLIDFAGRGKFQLLFAQVRGRGDAYYRSSLEPEGIQLERPVAEFDPFEYLLLRAHEAGIAVHAWVNVFYVWSDTGAAPPPGHLASRHPDWLITGPDGFRVDVHPVNGWSGEGAEGYFVAPNHPEARAFTVRVIEEIKNTYPLDGIHLDYVRYPGPGFGYDAKDRTDFILRWGVDPLSLLTDRPPLLDAAGTGGLALLDSLLVEERADAVDSLVIAVKRLLGDLPLSAAVFPDPQAARLEKGQDWVRWAHQGYVDFVVPMAYTYPPRELKTRMQFIRNLIGKNKFLVGLPLYNERVNHLKASIETLRRVGVVGFSLFSYNVMEDRRFAARFLDEAFFEGREDVESP